MAIQLGVYQILLLATPPTVRSLTQVFSPVCMYILIRGTHYRQKVIATLAGLGGEWGVFVQTVEMYGEYTEIPDLCVPPPSSLFSACNE